MGLWGSSPTPPLKQIARSFNRIPWCRCDTGTGVKRATYLAGWSRRHGCQNGKQGLRNSAVSRGSLVAITSNWTPAPRPPQHNGSLHHEEYISLQTMQHRNELWWTIHDTACQGRSMERRYSEVGAWKWPEFPCLEVFWYVNITCLRRSIPIPILYNPRNVFFALFEIICTVVFSSPSNYFPTFGFPIVPTDK